MALIDAVKATVNRLKTEMVFLDATFVIKACLFLRIRVCLEKDTYRKLIIRFRQEKKYDKRSNHIDAIFYFLEWIFARSR